MQKVKDCTACLVTGKNPEYQIPKNQHGKLEKITNREQELQIDFTGKVHIKIQKGKSQILIALDRSTNDRQRKFVKQPKQKKFLTF